MTEKSPLDGLADWYLAQCNGDWEHGFGIHVTTLDNPGWKLEINLLGTTLERATFSKVESTEDDQDWFSCAVKDGRFIAFCSPLRLPAVISLFLKWAHKP